MQHIPYAQIPAKVSSFFLAQLQHWEGGFVNDPNDYGGATNHGVTFATLRAWNPAATLQTLQALTWEEAVEIAYSMFYLGYGFGQFEPSDFILFFADWDWGSGIYGNKALQSLVGVAPDGSIGPKTVAAVNAYLAAHGKDALYQAILFHQDFLCDIVARDATQFKFLKGWLRRNIAFATWLER